MDAHVCKTPPLLSWTFRISVDPKWAADGFNPNAADIKDLVMDRLLPHAYGHEVDVETVAAPTPAALGEDCPS